MAEGLATGTFTSVHDAARSVLNNPIQTNVDRLRRKYRTLQRSGQIEGLIEHRVQSSNRPDWWFLDILTVPRNAAFIFSLFVNFYRT
jgi:hypothetical protein